MRINQYVKQWYDEDYDLRKEDFYVANARWMVAKCWKEGAIRHGIAALIIAHFCFGTGGVTLQSFGNALYLLAALTTAFFFYGILAYGVNDAEIGRVMYVLSLILFMWVNSKIPVLIQWLFALGGVILYVYLTIIVPIRASQKRCIFEQKLKDIENEEEERDKQAYAKWESEYRAYRNGLPYEDSTETDVMMANARQLFVGYESSAATLRDRYRQLAKRYHPDNGGDEDLFRCILAVYEELQQL